MTDKNRVLYVEVTFTWMVSGPVTVADPVVPAAVR